MVTRRPLSDDSPLEPQVSPDARDQDARYRYHYYLSPTCLSEVELAERKRLLKFLSSSWRQSHLTIPWDKRKNVPTGFKACIDTSRTSLLHIFALDAITHQFRLRIYMMIASPSVKIPPSLKVTEEQFRQLVKANPDLRLERTAAGELIVMTPTGSEGGSYNAELNADFVIWNRQTHLGKVFDSSTGFTLPNGAIRAPDVAWVTQHRWDALTPEQRKGFAPLCPDFVLELASEMDEIDDLRDKMTEYLDNGSRLGWLIDPGTHQVEIYRPAQPVEVLSAPAMLSGEDILPGFTLNLQAIFTNPNIPN